MLMKDAKKPSATLIITKMGKMMDKPQKDGAEQEPEDLDIAAEEMLHAIEQKDPTALKEAVKSMVQMCMDQYDTSDEETQEQE